MDVFGLVKKHVIEPVAPGLVNTPSSKRLNDKELLLLLARAAWDSYSLSGDCTGLELRDKQRQNSEGDNWLNGIQYGLYEILGGKHKGKKILAFRGTDLSNAVSGGMTLLQDLSVAFPAHGGPVAPIKLAIKAAVKATWDKDPDFICGHSLGGLIAECVCGETGKPGASFNAPGPWGVVPSNNLLTGDKYDGVKFEVNLTRRDPVSQVGSYMGPDHSHVGSPIWHDGSDHLMDPMIAEFGE